MLIKIPEIQEELIITYFAVFTSIFISIRLIYAFYDKYSTYYGNIFSDRVIEEYLFRKNISLFKESEVRILS